jgi:hypothetical protein
MIVWLLVSFSHCSCAVTESVDPCVSAFFPAHFFSTILSDGLGTSVSKHVTFLSRSMTSDSLHGVDLSIICWFQSLLTWLTWFILAGFGTCSCYMFYPTSTSTCVQILKCIYEQIVSWCFKYSSLAYYYYYYYYHHHHHHYYYYHHYYY